MKNYTIFTDCDFEAVDVYRDDYIEMILDREPDRDAADISDGELWAEYYATQELNFEDEQINLDIDLPGDVIALADLGLWYGRRVGYKILGDNLTDIFKIVEDYNTWTVDEYGNLKGKHVHHDGTNYVNYRMLRPELTDEQIDNFTDKLYEGTATMADIYRYTVRLGDLPAQVYGWKLRGVTPKIFRKEAV